MQGEESCLALPRLVIPFQGSNVSEEKDNFNSRHHECENGKSAVIWIFQVKIADIIKMIRYRDT